MRRRIICLVGLVAFTITFMVGGSAFSAEFTDLLDAADDKDDLIEGTFDPFDFNIEPRFRMDFESATISREAACVPNESDLVGDAAKNNPRVVVNRGRCSEARTITNKEMEYKATNYQLDLAFRFGVYKDLEFTVVAPYVIGVTRGLKYADGVDETNSSVDPSDQTIADAAGAVYGNPDEDASAIGLFTGHRFMDLSEEYNEVTRSGFGDPSIQLQWAPFNDERDDTKATLLVGMKYQMPISPVRLADNTDVGEGVHELSWRVASSKKFTWIEPYFGLDYALAMAATDSPIQRVDKSNQGQVITNPPQQGKITIGTEFIPYENPAKGERYGIDLRFEFGYTSAGRDYSPLFDQLGSKDNSCNGRTIEDVRPEFQNPNDTTSPITNPGDVGCAWIVRQPSNAQPDPVYDLAGAINSGDDSVWANDGIMSVEGYGTFSGMLGFYAQPVKYFQFKAQVGLKTQQEHYLTNARTGRDADDSLEDSADDTVDIEGPDASLEKNPVYNPSYDQTGNRFRIQAYTTWTVLLTGAFQF